MGDRINAPFHLVEYEPDSSSLEGTLNPPDLKGFLGQDSLIPNFGGGLLHFVVINSMVLGMSRPNMTSCHNESHPEERTPQLWA